MTNPINNWYQRLLDRINEKAEEFGLDDTQANVFRDFVTTLARDQYKAGNRSGIGWAFEQARRKAANGQPI